MLPLGRSADTRQPILIVVVLAIDASAGPQGQLRMLEGQTHEVNPGVLAPVLVEFFTS